MAVIYTLIYKPYPGKAPAALERITKSKPLLEKLGAEVRVLMNTAGGIAPQSIMLALTYPDYTTFGRVFDESSADPDFQKLQQEIAAEPYSELVSTAIWSDIL